MINYSNLTQEELKEIAGSKPSETGHSPWEIAEAIRIVDEKNGQVFPQGERYSPRHTRNQQTALGLREPTDAELVRDSLEF